MFTPKKIALISLISILILLFAGKSWSLTIGLSTEELTRESDTVARSPVYRFWSDTYRGHFFTISAEEKDYIIATYPSNVWRYEGIAYYAFTTATSGASPVYRFWSDTYLGHFFTISSAEKDYIIATYPSNIWKYEGIAWYAYATQTQGTSPVYRFWSDTYRHHFFTISSAEKDYIIATYPPHIWRYEGIAWYAGESGGGNDINYKLTTEEALLSAAKDSNEFNDTLNYARELGYTGALNNVTEYPMSDGPSVFIATISNNAGKMVAIVYDPRTPPVFLPAYLIIPENENKFRLITRNGGLLIENPTSPNGPQISVIEGKNQSTLKYQHIRSQINADCKQAFKDALYCVRDKLTDIREIQGCLLLSVACVATALLNPPLYWATFATYFVTYAGRHCGRLAITVMDECLLWIRDVPCDDMNNCTSADTCNLVGQCKGKPITECIGGDGCCPSGCNNFTDSDCKGEKCANIAGTWSGTSTYFEDTLQDTLPITLFLSQDGCNITGIIKSPDSCPAQCGFFDSGNITGSVSVNTFTFTMAKDPLVDCESCEFICYGTDQGSLTVNGNRMYGTAKVEDCEDKTFINATLDLTRSSSISSLKTLGKKKDIKKSSILSSKCCGK